LIDHTTRGFVSSGIIEKSKAAFSAETAQSHPGTAGIRANKKKIENLRAASQNRSRGQVALSKLAAIASCRE
jgi:hypothetical protein